MAPPLALRLRSARAKLPFLLALILLWTLLWGVFTPLSLTTGVLVAAFVMRSFQLPPVELSGRIHLGHALYFIVAFLIALTRGALLVAWQVLDRRRHPGTAIIAVALRSDDDLVMTHVAVTTSLIPGSLVLEADRERRILYMHVLGVNDAASVERFRADALRWEARIIRAVGSREELRRLRAREASA